MQIIQKNIKDLKNFEKNNRKHPQSQIDVIKKSLIDYWRTQNCVIEKDGTLVIWHWRVEACRQLTEAGEKGWDTIPCIDTKNLTKSQIRKLRIIDNKSSEMAEWDIGNLKVELDELGDLELNDLFIDMKWLSDPDIDFDDIKSNADRERANNEKKVCCPECWHNFTI